MGHETSAEILGEWLSARSNTFAILEDPNSGSTATLLPVTVIERATDKRISFAWGQVRQAELARNHDTGASYVRVFLDDDRRFAFAGMGIVFAPSFASTGPLPDCPSTACFFDYHRLFGHLEHLVADRHEEHGHEALRVLMVLLAFIDGARALGVDVSSEERALDEKLERLEKLGACSAQ